MFDAAKGRALSVIAAQERSTTAKASFGRLLGPVVNGRISDRRLDLIWTRDGADKRLLTRPPRACVPRLLKVPE